MFRRETHLEAIEKLVRNDDKVVGIPGLQGSFCLFDQRHALVRSGPITKFGDWAQRDYGVFVHNHGAIQAMLKDYENLLRNADSKIIDGRRLKEIEAALAKLGLDETPEKTLTREEVKNLYGLTDWTLDIFDCVKRINGDRFILADVYRFEDELARLHPRNNNVKAKIRQQLQVLRDKGLVKFYGNGQYRKLDGLKGL